MQPTRHEFLFFDHWWEKPLFYVLVAASLVYMAWQIVARVRLWKQGRPVDWTPKGSVEAAKKWIVNVCVFVLAQKKVRSSRKKTGAPMHLLIFYGFMSLFLATTLLAIATYGPYNFHHGTYYLVYEVTFDFLGLLMMVGLGWALVRRTLALKRELGAAAIRETDDQMQVAKQMIDRRRWPMSNNWHDFFALALLFTIGLTGYWLEAARISADPKSWDNVSFVGYWWAQLEGAYSPAAYKAVWWFHVAWVLVFFAVIPKFRLRHILLAISTAAGRTEAPMGQLQPISMEEVEQTEQIGVKLAKDYSRWHLMSLDACMECGRCTEVCPAWNVGKVLNPKQVVQDVRDAMVSGQEVASVVSEEALWACTTCNACVEACPVLIRHVDLIVDARRNLVSEGQLRGPAATMLRQTASTGNAWGQAASNREDWMKGMDIPLCRDGVEFDFLFWVGCAGATDPGAIRTTKAVATLLRQAGIRFACLGREEACTGDPARRVGDEFLFQEKAMTNSAMFEAYNVKKIVTACPHCLNTFKNEYARFSSEGLVDRGPMSNIEVFHHSQLLAGLVEEGKLKSASTGSNVVFHDPCYLARVNHESDAPRAVLGRPNRNLNEQANPDPDPGEPEHFGNKTLCCGAGGGRMWMEEAPDQRPSVRRAQELLATGATTVAVACPFCRIMLGDSIKQVKPDDEIKLIDLAEALQEANS
jgi:Fe-S oxidoreductase